MSDNGGGAGGQGSPGTGEGAGGAAGGQGSTGTEGQGSDTATQGAGGAGGAGQGAGGGKFSSLEEAERAVAEREAENAKYRERVRKLEEAEAARQREGMSELEQAKAAQAEAEAKAKKAADDLAKRDFRDDATVVARKLGFRDPELAHRLVGREDVTDDEGAVDKAKLEKALKAELQAHGYLGTGGGGDGGGGRRRDGGGGSGGAGFNQDLRDQIRAKKGAGG